MLTIASLEIETSSLPGDSPVYRGVFVSSTTQQRYVIELGRRTAKRIQRMLLQDQARAEQLAIEAANRQ